MLRSDVPQVVVDDVWSKPAVLLAEAGVQRLLFGHFAVQVALSSPHVVVAVVDIRKFSRGRSGLFAIGPSWFRSRGRF